MPGLVFPKAEEVLVSWDEAKSMFKDPSLIVVMAIEHPSSEKFLVSYWKNERGMLPPWIRPSAELPPWAEG